MFVSTILEKIEETRLRFSQGSVTVLQKMPKYQEVRVKLTHTQLNKLKSAAKNKTGTILRLNKKSIQDEELPHDLFLTTRQTSKVRNAFPNSMSTDKKLSKAQIPKIIQPGGSFGYWLDNLEKESLTNIALHLARDNLPGLVSSLISNAINNLKKISGKGAVRAGKGFILFISNENMKDIIKIIKSLGDSGVLINGVTETVKYKIKNNRVDFMELC